MIRILTTIFSILFCAITFAQSVPQGINYQAVARDASGAVLMNQNLTIQFSVISDITTSAVSWQETHTVTTNDYGLYTAIIGQGTSTSVGSSATFDVVDWGASNHLLKVDVDYGGGIFVDMGTTAFMSVPYSMNALNSTSQSLTISGDTIFISNGNFVILPSSVHNLQIGDIYSGGIIFYLDGNGGGLVAATFDQSNAAEWGCNGFADTITGADGTAIGTGNQNTIDIEAGCTTPETAADICTNLTLNGYSDWFLPSKDELFRMYTNICSNSALGNIGGFYDEAYWSSTEYNNTTRAWYLTFSYSGSASPGNHSKSQNKYVRAIRAF